MVVDDIVQYELCVVVTLSIGLQVESTHGVYHPAVCCINYSGARKAVHTWYWVKAPLRNYELRCDTLI